MWTADGKLKLKARNPEYMLICTVNQMLRPYTFTHPAEIQIVGTNSTFYRGVRAGGIMLDVDQFADEKRP